MNKFTNWLNDQLRERKLKAADLARDSGLAPSTISRILNGETTPSDEAYTKIARALGEPPEKVLRIAGRLPALPPSEDITIRSLIELASLLPADERLELLRYADYRYQQYKKRHDQEEDDKSQSANSRARA